MKVKYLSAAHTVNFLEIKLVTVNFEYTVRKVSFPNSDFHENVIYKCGLNNPLFYALYS